MLCKTLFFTAPRSLEIRESGLPNLAPDQVMVETVLSAISPGTEMLIYRGQFPHMAVDANIEALGGEFHYPLPYGYAAVGRVMEIGKQVDKDWLGRLVFS